MSDGRRRGRAITRRRVLLGGGAAVSALGLGTGQGAGIGTERATGTTARARTSAGSDSEWSTYQGNARRTGRTTAIEKPETKHWSVGNESEPATVPTVVGDRVYLGVDDRVLKLTLDGSVEWAYSAPAAVERSVTVGEESVFVPTTDGRLVAVDRKRGEEQWRQGTNEALTPPAVADGTVCVGTEAGTLFAFDAETGDPLWRHAESLEFSPGWIRGVPKPLHPTPAIGDGTVYTHFALGDRTKVAAFDIGDGTVQWDHEIPDETQVYPPVVGEKGLYVLGGGFVTRLSRAGGVQQWTVSTATGAHSLRPPALGETHLYASSHDNSVARYFAIDRLSGEVTWEYEVDEYTVNGISTDGSTAYLVADGTLVAVDGKSGLERWRYPVGSDGQHGRSPIGVPGGDGILLNYGHSVLKLGVKRTGGQTDAGTDRATTPVEYTDTSTGAGASGASEGTSVSSGGGSGGLDVSLTTIESLVVIVSSVLGGLYTLARLLKD